MKDLKDMKREDIFDTELIGEGLPDLETEIAKMNQGKQDDQDIFGFGQENESEDY